MAEQSPVTDDDDERHLHDAEAGQSQQLVWEVGSASEDEDEAEAEGHDPFSNRHAVGSRTNIERVGLADRAHGPEGHGLMEDSELQDEEPPLPGAAARRSTSSEATAVRTSDDPFKVDDEFGGWQGADDGKR